MTDEEIVIESDRLVEYKNNPNDKRHDEYFLLTDELRERKKKRKRDRERLEDPLALNLDKLLEYLGDRELLDFIPYHILPNIIDNGFRVDTFEEQLAKDGQSLILLLKLESLSEKEILNVWKDNGNTFFSVKLESGNIISINYKDFVGGITGSLAEHKRRLEDADNKLSMSDEERIANIAIYGKKLYEKTQENENRWNNEIQKCGKRINSFQNLKTLIWQSVERSNAINKEVSARAREIVSTIGKSYTEINEKQAKKISDLELKVIQKEVLLDNLQSEKIEKAPESLKKFGYRELKEKLESLLKRDECIENKTVSSDKIAKWVREITKEGYITRESTIRAKLSDMGYTTEKPSSK